MQYDGQIKWLPVSAVAKTLSVTRQRVYSLIDQGKLSSVKIDGTVLVSERSVSMRLLQLAFEEGRRASRKEDK